MQIVIKTNGNKEGLTVAVNPTMFLNQTRTNSDLMQNGSDGRCCILSIGFEKFTAEQIDSIEVDELSHLQLYDVHVRKILTALKTRNPRLQLTINDQPA